METLPILLTGILIGLVATIAYFRTIPQSGISEDNLINKLRDSLASMSLEALTKNSEHFIKFANETLDKQTRVGEKDLENKKTLIDRELSAMKLELQKVEELISALEKDREKKFGELSSQLKVTAEQTGKLHDTANQLKEVLANSRVRGQWGERMAEDVLRLAGMIENVNYSKQRSMESGSTRPDFTFFLPQGLTVNMDVKFPLDNYVKYIESSNDHEKNALKEHFLRDAKQRIKAVTSRDYINTNEGTVDYVIVFIPNEQVYSFIHEHDNSLLDDALKNKVIICSPITLYAILAVIRQSIENFNLQKTSGEMLSIFGQFYKQWAEFMRTFDRLGKKIEETQEEYHYLTTTRKNQLDRPVRRIEDLRKAKGIPISLDQPTESEISPQETTDSI